MHTSNPQTPRIKRATPIVYHNRNLLGFQRDNKNITTSCAARAAFLLFHRQDAAFQRIADQVSLAVQPQLAHHVGAVRLHRARADAQPRGNFGVIVAFGGQVQHLAFAAGERLVLRAVMSRAAPTSDWDRPSDPKTTDVLTSAGKRDPSFRSRAYSMFLALPVSNTCRRLFIARWRSSGAARSTTFF